MKPVDRAPRRAPRPGSTRPRAFATDIRRTITGNLKRFVSLFIITALGATMLVGLKAACDDLRATADSYFDAQRLFDISIRSTLGLSQEDVDALGELDGVEVAEGGYTETAYTEVEGAREKVDLRALSTEGLNEPQLVEGRLPRDDHEVAVTQKYLDASGKRIGDTVEFQQEQTLDPQSESSVKSGGVDGAASDSQSGAANDASPDGESAGTDDADSTAIFARGKYTITGAVLDPMDVNAGSKTMSFRSSSGTKYAFFLTLNAVKDRDTFTVAYLLVKGAAALPAYSDEYEVLVDEVKQEAEGIREARELARTDGVKDEAAEEIDKAEAEANEQLADAAGELADAQSQIDDALAQIAKGKGQLAQQRASAEEQLAAAQQQIDASRAQVESALSMAGMLQSFMGDRWPAGAWGRLQNGDSSARGEFVGAVDAFMQDTAAKAQEGAALCDELAAAIEQMEPANQGEKERIYSLVDRLVALGHMTDEQADRIKGVIEQYPEDEAQKEAIRNEILQLKGTIEAVSSQLPQFSGVAGQLADAALAGPALDAAERELGAKRAEAERQLAAGAAELANGEREAASGQAELEEGRSELERQRADAEAKFSDARAEVDGIEDARWYIQDRSSLPSYASVESDASSIESIATVFPLIFFTVAVLISLTTVTRMVEEDRGLIGLYKALGYGRGRILSKYLIYSFAACLTGGIAGDALGFIVLPEVIFTIFRTMYALPDYQLGFNAVSAVAGVALFAVGIVGATFLACRHALRETPASLMRPKAPRAGKRILLERIGFIWRRMGFLNKVSARNLFRYKKRFLMTVFGIAGCTALMICGLGIRDTVISLKPRQYGEQGIARYDLMAVTADADFAEGERELRDTGEVEQMLEARIDTVTVEFDSVKESVQLMVLPNGADLSPYMRTDSEAGAHLELPDEGAGALITKNAEQVLGFKVGDELAVQDSTLREGTLRVDGVTVNYLGNFVFMTEDAYRTAFGETPAPNAFLANLSGSVEEKIALADELAAGETFVSVSSAAKIANDFSEAFKIIDVVVYIVTVMAAALAFAVVFTLSNTNISERERELATIKVLGFRRREVYRYINKETIILTLIGIVVGFPMGYGITRFLTYVLRMPSLFFDTIVDPPTYLVAGVASLVFTLVINQVTNRLLDRIVMVEALKSAE